MARTGDTGQDVVRTSFALPAELVAEFKEATKARDTTMSREIRQLIRAYVAEHKREAA